MVGGMSGLDRDVPPYTMAAGPRAKLYGINQRGLSRAGFSRETVDALKTAFRIIWRRNTNFSEGIRQARSEIPPSPEINRLFEFLSVSRRGILR
jgi:UDP-N-acetylglucosamine acyltransferase